MTPAFQRPGSRVFIETFIPLPHFSEEVIIGGHVKKLFRLNPSDFAFLWQECRKCFYEKVVLDARRPRTPMPGIFIKIDLLMKDFFEGRPTTSIDSALPSGSVKFGDRWVRSDVIRLPGHESGCYVVGRLDTMLSFDDGSFGVVDFKTTNTKDPHVPLYGRQLHAYAYSLEHPAVGTEGLWPVSTLGLLCVEPSRMTDHEIGFAFASTPCWVPVSKSEEEFLAFMDEVMSVLELSSPPDAGPGCGWCRYRSTAA